jgi:hypothetical protein
MRATPRITCISILLLLTACGKSGKLVPLLPDAPAGWNVEGKVTTQDVSGVGYSSMRSYVPAESAPGVKIRRVEVQILVAEQGAKEIDLRKMYLGGSGAAFWERTTVNGFDAADSFTVSGAAYSRVVYPASSIHVQIVAFNDGTAPDNDTIDKAKAIVQAFSDRVNFKQIATLK